MGTTATEELPAEVEAEESALITVGQQTDHHVITGMAALARMSPAEYESTISTVIAGMERVKDFQKRAMIEGEDYGRVKGIERPFLHLPGAEKLCLLYGLAVRQEADRIDGIERHGWTDMSPDAQGKFGRWTTPPIAYHVRSYVHLGSFDGPVVGMGYGEANSWEDKYRYRWGKSKCPDCGREGLIKGKQESRLRGKFWCPGAEGGCNRTFEPNDPRVIPAGKIENPDPYSQAETLLQMAAKRSLVAATRRATGTSGLFTQDEDAPTVQRQAEAEPPSDDAEPVIEAVPEQEVEKGGKPVKPTAAQISHLSKVSKAKDLGPDAIMAAIKQLGLPAIELEGDRGAKGRALLMHINATLTADQMGALLQTIDMVFILPPEAPDAAVESEAPTKATN
jgi:hypothetical protein